MRGNTDPYTEPALPVQIVQSPSQFAALSDNQTDAIIWNRRLPESVTSALQELPSHDVSNGRFSITADEVRTCALDLFHQWRIDIGQAAHWLAADIEILAKQMVKLLSTRHLLLRVELIRDDACRKFHCDMVKARVICTYSGPGTEYCIPGADGATSQTVNAPTGCPILLKGKLWPGGSQQTVLHRSPSIENTSISRLVVVLNEASSR